MYLTNSHSEFIFKHLYVIINANVTRFGDYFTKVLYNIDPFNGKDNFKRKCLLISNSQNCHNISRAWVKVFTTEIIT